MMPNLDGFGLLRALRADPNLRAVPVIMLSARAGEEARVEGVEAGADDYLVKPFSARELVARVGSVLQLAELRNVLDKERALLGFAQSAANIGVYDWDLRGGKVYWSPQLYGLLGLTPEEVPATFDGWMEHVVEEDRATALASFEEAAERHDGKHEVEIRVRTKSGGVRFIRLFQEITYGGDGKPARVVGAAIDIQQIVERRELEQSRLRERLAAADEERRRLLTVLGSAPAIMNYMRGPDLVMDIVHPLAHRFYRGRDVQGRPLLEAFPELRDQPFPTRLRHVYDTGETLHHEREVARLEIDGELQESYWTSTYLPIRDAAGNVDGVLTFDLDVTDVVRADAEREALLVAAEQANRAKDDFIGLPVMDGYELAQRIRELDPEVALIAITGYGQDSDRKRSRDVGFREHLTKPVDLDALARILDGARASS